jgi:hypothetical protein
MIKPMNADWIITLPSLTDIPFCKVRLSSAVRPYPAFPMIARLRRRLNAMVSHLFAFPVF